MEISQSIYNLSNLPNENFQPNNCIEENMLTELVENHDENNKTINHAKKISSNECKRESTNAKNQINNKLPNIPQTDNHLKIKYSHKKVEKVEEEFNSLLKKFELLTNEVNKESSFSHGNSIIHDHTSTKSISRENQQLIKLLDKMNDIVTELVNGQSIKAKNNTSLLVQNINNKNNKNRSQNNHSIILPDIVCNKNINNVNAANKFEIGRKNRQSTPDQVHNEASNIEIGLLDVYKKEYQMLDKKINKLSDENFRTQIEDSLKYYSSEIEKLEESNQLKKLGHKQQDANISRKLKTNNHSDNNDYSIMTKFRIDYETLLKQNELTNEKIASSSNKIKITEEKLKEKIECLKNLEKIAKENNISSYNENHDKNRKDKKESLNKKLNIIDKQIISLKKKFDLECVKNGKYKQQLIEENKIVKNKLFLYEKKYSELQLKINKYEEINPKCVDIIVDKNEKSNNTLENNEYKATYATNEIENIQ